MVPHLLVGLFRTVLEEEVGAGYPIPIAPIPTVEVHEHPFLIQIECGRRVHAVGKRDRCAK